MSAVDLMVLDPTGLGGDRIHRNEQNLPHVVEVWAFPASLSHEAIHNAWYAAPRRERTLILGITPYRVSAGKRFVTLHLYVEAQKPTPHIEEPDV